MVNESQTHKLRIMLVLGVFIHSDHTVLYVHFSIRLGLDPVSDIHVSIPVVVNVLRLQQWPLSRVEKCATFLHNIPPPAECPH